MSSIRIRDLTLAIHKKVLFKSINMDLLGGAVIALLGANGSGKTTLLKTLAGIKPINSQNILFDGKDLNEMDSITRSRLISMMLQHTPIDPYAIALDRILHGLIPDCGLYKVYTQDAINKLHMLAKELNIKHLLHRPLGNLSGGEQRLVYIAKSLLGPSTKYFLFDEPTVYLDKVQKKKLGFIFRSLANTDKIIIFSSHDEAFIKEFADSSIQIEATKIKYLKTLS